MQNTLPRQALITIYKAFVRPHLDYGDILYDQACNASFYQTFVRPHLDYGDIFYDQAYNPSFHQKLEKIQYNACIAITGAIRGISKEKIYEELGLESLESRRWLRKLFLF